MKTLFSFLLLLIALQVSADDTIYMEETVITGNQELPKVLYILPWREMEKALLPQRAFEYDTQSVLTPVYPEVQKRELELRQRLNDARRRAEQNNTSPVANH